MSTGIPAVYNRHDRLMDCSPTCSHTDTNHRLCSTPLCTESVCMQPCGDEWDQNAPVQPPNRDQFVRCKSVQ